MPTMTCVKNLGLVKVLFAFLETCQEMEGHLFEDCYEFPLVKLWRVSCDFNFDFSADPKESEFYKKAGADCTMELVTRCPIFPLFLPSIGMNIRIDHRLSPKISCFVENWY